MSPAAVGRYLSVPLQLAPILFVATFSVLAVLAQQAGIFGIPLLIILFVGFCNYSFAVMDSMANGAKEAPTISAEMMNPVSSVTSLAVLAIVSAAFFGAGAASHWMGWMGELLLGLAAVAVLLTVVTAQGASGSIVQAFNPWRCYRMIVQLGADYALLFACALGIFLLGFALTALPLVPTLVTMPLMMVGWLAVFCLIGGVLRERREDLGIDEVETPGPVPLAYKTELEKEHDALVDRIYAQWRSGAHVNAWESVTRHLESSADPVEELRWLGERIARWPDKRMANRIAEERIVRLLAARRNGEVLSAIDLRLQADPDFRPHSSADLLRWAELAIQGGERRIARKLLTDFPRLYPGNPQQEAVQRLRDRLGS